MPPRASNRKVAAAAKKSSPSVKAKKPNPTPKQVVAPSSAVEGNGASESVVQLSKMEENKDLGSMNSTTIEGQETLQEFVKSNEQVREGDEVKEIKSASEVSTANEREIEEVLRQNSDEKEINDELEVLMTKVTETEEVSSSGDEEKVVIREEVSVTTTVIVEETKVIEEAAEEKKPDNLSENPPGSSLENMEEPKEVTAEQNGSGVDNKTDRVPMDVDEGASQSVVEKETAAAQIEDAKESADGNDSEGETSGDDEEENEEDGDSSLYMHAPLTDRKKQKDFEIFVGGLDKETVEEDLIEVFRKFGEIQAARIVKHPNTKKSRGFGFIRYASAELARKVLAELKDGMEVRGKRVGISASQDNDTLYMGNICKTWRKEHVLETLKSFGIEEIEELYLPDDPKNEGKSKGFALLEFSTHSEAMAAFQRLKKPDAIFGLDRSAKIAFAQTPMHPSEEALSQVKTVFIEGLTDSWDEEKVKDICKQYGEIEKVQLSRNLVTKRNDFGFVAFTSREGAIACVEGINSTQIEGDIKIKAELARPHNKGRLQKKGARGGFKVKEREKMDEAGLSKAKGHAKPKGDEGKGKALSKFKSAKGGKPYKSQSSYVEGKVAGAPSRSERTNLQRKELPAKATKRGRKDMDAGNSKQPLKKPRGITHGRASNRFRNQGNSSRFVKARPNYNEPSVTYRNPYSHGYPASASSYEGHAYGSVSGSKRRYSDMEPHAGYLQPAAEKQGRNPYGYGLRSSGGYGIQGSSAAAYGGGSALPPYSMPNSTSYTGYEDGGSGGYYPKSVGYPPRPTYY